MRRQQPCEGDEVKMNKQVDIRQEWLAAAIFAMDRCHPADARALCHNLIGESAPLWPPRHLFPAGADEALARDACDALALCHRDIAVQIAEAALEQMRTGGPHSDLMGDIRREARWWAELAPAHELRAYVVAALDQLGQRAISDKARKEVFAALWKGMGEPDRAAFLQAIGAANG
jgi:hypothetical protein